MRITELFENARAPLYHGTTLRRAEGIIAADLLKAAMPVRGDAMPTAAKGHTATVSFSRDKAAARRYAAGDHPADVSTVLVIDQDALKHMVGTRLQPYDDTRSAAYGAEYARWNNAPVPPGVFRKDAEEVVFGNIPGINKCVTQILITPTTGMRDVALNVMAIAKSPLIHDPRAVVEFSGKRYTPSDFLDFAVVPGNIESDTPIKLPRGN